MDDDDQNPDYSNLRAYEVELVRWVPFSVRVGVLAPNKKAAVEMSKFLPEDYNFSDNGAWVEDVDMDYRQESPHADPTKVEDLKNGRLWDIYEPDPGDLYVLRRCTNPDIVGDSNESAIRYLLDRAVSKADVYQDHINDDTIDEIAKALSGVLRAKGTE